MYRFLRGRRLVDAMARSLEFGEEGGREVSEDGKKNGPSGRALAPGRTPGSPGTCTELGIQCRKAHIPVIISDGRTMRTVRCPELWYLSLASSRFLKSDDQPRIIPRTHLIHSASMDWHIFG